MSMESRGTPTVSAPIHYPPAELLLNVNVVNGKYVATERVPIPTDEHGVPDPHGVLTDIGSQIIFDSPFFESLATEGFNNHHLLAAGRKKEFLHRFGMSSLEAVCRDDATLRLDLPIIIHNFAHLREYERVKASEKVMQSRGKERKIARRLFEVGDSVTWLEMMREQGDAQYAAAIESIRLNGYRRNPPFYQSREYLLERGKILETDRKLRPIPTRTMFYDELARVKTPQWGIMPDPEVLAAMEFEDAVALLTEIAEAKAVYSVEQSVDIMANASYQATYGKAA
jgi:hypothetical protein